MVWHGRIILLVIVGMMLLVCGASAYLAGYGYYQDMTVNNTGSALSYYQMNFTVYTGSGTSSGTTIYLNSHSESDLDDLRFTNTSDTVYDYWIESTSNPYNVWVEVPYIPAGNSTVMVQYGNSGASAYSNGTNTFPEFFDDFSSGTLDTTIKWKAPVDYSLSGGFLQLNPASNGAGALYSKTKHNFETYVLRGRHKVSSIGVNTRVLFGFNTAQTHNAGTYQGSFEFQTSVASLLTIRQGSGVVHKNIPNINDDTNYYVTEIWKSGTTVYITSTDSSGNSGSNSSASYTDATASNYIECEAYTGQTNYIDFVLMRKYTATEPTVPTWSGESPTASAPVAAFSANRTTGAPGDVAFTDASTNTPTSWAWSFGDGTPNSTDQNPTHTFSAAGTYTITLTATNLVGSDVEEKVDYITFTDVPVAAFHANVTSGYAPLSVLFTDDSTNTPTSWAWSWGDGTANGTTQNPNYIYTTAGTYNVTLTATNAGGSDGETKLSYISVYELVAFPGCASIPTDIDADGLYEDINGNTRKDWSDIILFFKYRVWAAVNEPPDAFDWNSNGIIDYKDVLMLYDEGV